MKIKYSIKPTTAPKNTVEWWIRRIKDPEIRSKIMATKDYEGYKTRKVNCISDAIQYATCIIKNEDLREEYWKNATKIELIPEQ